MQPVQIINAVFSQPKRPNIMKNKVIHYQSGPKKVSSDNTATVLETGKQDGIKHTWSGYVDKSNHAVLIWKFDWEDLKNQGFDRLVGQLIVHYDCCDPVSVDIDWTATNQTVWAVCGNVSETVSGNVSRISNSRFGDHSGWNGPFSVIGNDRVFIFQYTLTAHHSKLPPPEKISLDDMFAASDKTDAILVVEGKKLNVNKAFLSFHSDYFSTLFSSNFKEEQMKEIEIKEVSYEDFGLLLSSFSPNPQFPNDHTVEKLIEMASRFQVTSVIRIVEYHLLHNSRIGYEKMLWLADEYGMPQLLKKCINQMDSLEKVKRVKTSPRFETVSDKTKSLILSRLLETI